MEIGKCKPKAPILVGVEVFSYCGSISPRRQDWSKIVLSVIKMIFILNWTSSATLRLSCPIKDCLESLCVQHNPRTATLSLYQKPTDSKFLRTSCPCQSAPISPSASADEDGWWWRRCRRSTFDVRRSTFDVRRSTFDVRRSTLTSSIAQQTHELG